ncbi:MAG: anaerobic ribonucleoside-triphosphate reductase activating protein [Ruminococcus sp.]|nr:anaerobic ribonucleoside-triphosphate reductase activating protein [Ruminococcus sp.]MCM1382444.1 anaerobic ribonucleoside-triphosphate reductase activating protein [Muribaculaceae bacterium]
MLNGTLKIAGTVNDSIVDGPGFRFTVFVQGCPHRCEGCHNPQTHDFEGGEEVSLESLLEKIKGNPLLDGVTFSGGEPFCQAERLYTLGTEVKKLGLNVVTYTGYTFEYLTEKASPENFYGELLSVTDYLVDGRFELDKRDILLKFRGSSNQRIIDVKRSLAEKRVVETEI